MTNILVSTDFSSNGKKIALHAAKLAQRVKARLILVHVYDAESTKCKPINTEARVQTQLDKLACKLHQATGISITRLIKPASGPDLKSELIKMLKADLVILCNQQSDHFIHTKHLDLPVIHVSAALPFDTGAFQACLAEQLNATDHNSPSALLEAV